MAETFAYPLLSHSLIALLLAMLPGTDMMLVIGAVAKNGIRAGLLTTAGISIGCFIWALLVVVGLVSILRASPFMFDIITYAGVGYTLYLGFGELRAGLAKRRASQRMHIGARGDSLYFVKRGLLVNLLNPKVGIFYISFLPQFLPDGKLTVPNVLLLGSRHILFGIIWLGGCSVAVDKARQLIANDSFNRSLMVITGFLIIILAMMILWSRLGQT